MDQTNTPRNGPIHINTETGSLSHFRMYVAVWTEWTDGDLLEGDCGKEWGAAYDSIILHGLKVTDRDPIPVRTRADGGLWIKPIEESEGNPAIRAALTSDDPPPVQLFGVLWLVEEKDLTAGSSQPGMLFVAANGRSRFFPSGLTDPGEIAQWRAEATLVNARNKQLGFEVAFPGWYEVISDPLPSLSLDGSQEALAAESGRSFASAACDDAAINATPEAFALTALFSDFPQRLNMTVNTAAMRVVHHRPNATARTYLDLSDQLAYDPDATEEDTTASLLSAVGQYNVSRDEALVCLYVLARLLDSEGGKADIGFTELLDVDGARGLGRTDRIERAKAYHDALKVASSWKVHMRRPWREAHGKSVTVEQDSALFFYGGPAFLEGQKPLPGMAWNAPPHGFSIHDSNLSTHFRRNPKQAGAFGPLLQISRIPRGKAWGDWAVSVGLSIGVFVGRVGAQHSGGTIRYSRRVLLMTFPPHLDPLEILNGPNPKRAKEYWGKAMDTLQEQGMILGYDEPQNDARTGWKDGWLDEIVTVRLGGQWAKVADSVKASSTGRIESAKKKRTPKKAAA